MIENSHLIRELEERKAALENLNEVFNPAQFSIKDKKIRKETARNDDAFFLKEYFPDLFDKEFGPIQYEIMALTHKRGHELHLICGPRGWGKSEIIRGLRIKKMLFKEIRNGIRVGENLEDSENELAMTKLELELNPRLRNDFGDVADKRFWSNKHIRLTNGVSFKAISVNVKGRGISPRPDYAEIDDFEDRESAANPERGAKKLDWLIAEFYLAVTLGGVIVWLGNNLSLDSACNQFIEEIKSAPNSKFFTHIYKAIETDADGNEYSTWEAGMPIEVLREIRATIGTVRWEAEMQQNPLRPGEIFKYDWFSFVDYSEIEKEKDKRKVGIFLDPGYGKSETSCYKAIIVFTSDGAFYDITDAWVRQTSVSAMCHAWFEMVNKWKAWNLMFAKFEDTLSQQLLLGNFKEVARERKEPLMISGVAGDKWFQAPKPLRIETLSMPIETGIVRFVKRNGELSQDMKRLIEQFTNYPKKPDDGPDSAASCFHLLAGKIRQGKQRMYRSLAKRRAWRDTIL